MIPLQSVDPDRARSEVRDILDDRRFESDPAPRPFRGPLRWIGDRLATIGDWIGNVIDAVPWFVWLAIGIALLALAARWILARAGPRSKATRERRERIEARATREDPDALERDAAEAERRGDFDRAVRLRFRAGLLRLDDRGAIDYRPSLTTTEVRNVLDSEPFDDLATTFDEVAYGGLTADENDVAVAARDLAAGCPGVSRSESAHRMTARQRNVAYGVGIVILVIVALNVIARGLDSAVGGRQPGGARGSSYATAENGLAAYAQLLSDYGHPVRRQRGALGEARIDPAATLFVTASDRPAPLEPEEVATIRDFVRDGGRAVVVALTEPEIRAIAGATPQVTDGVREYREFASELGDLRVVRTGARAAYRPDAEFSVLAAEGELALLIDAAAGGGDLLLLSDASPIENAGIGAADNAAFGLALPGAAERPVVFAEGVHGYGERSGLAALPGRWKVALVALGGAAVLFAWSRARRLGPPDQPDRELPPARSMYVDALASTLERTDDRARALAPLGDWVRSRVRSRAGLTPDAEPEAVTAAAQRLGLTDAEIATLWQPPADADAVLTLGRAATKMIDEGTGP